MRALFTAATGMAAQQHRLDTIAHNLANVSTTGYKKSRDQFQDLFYQELTHGGLAANTGRMEIGTGVRLAGVQKDHSRMGTLTDTGNPLHMAINGKGFFKLETIDGNEVYSRDGTFRLDAGGQLVNASGLSIAGGITVPPTAEQVVILEDGTINALLAGESEYTTLGQIQVVDFTNPAGLRSAGGNVYELAPESGDELALEMGVETSILQGFLEGSNVDVAEELVQMIMTQRSYELNSKMISAADETMRTAANIKR